MISVILTFQDHKVYTLFGVLLSRTQLGIQSSDSCLLVDIHNLSGSLCTPRLRLRSTYQRYRPWFPYRQRWGTCNRHHSVCIGFGSRWNRIRLGKGSHYHLWNKKEWIAIE